MNTIEMSDTNNEYIKEQKIAEIFGNRKQLTEEQLEMLRSDDSLRDACQLLQDIKSDYQKSNDPVVDVEAKLRKFKKKHSTGDKFNYRLVFTSLSIAAAIIGFILYITIPSQNDVVPYIANVATKNDNPVNLKVENGIEYTIGSTKTHFSAIDIRHMQIFEERPSENAELIVPEGQNLDVTLSDGSMVYMKSGSRLSFPSIFSDSVRSVAFQGEAYFKIARNESAPFIVYTKDFVTTVLGTEFYINTRSKNAPEVTLVSGKVNVSFVKNESEHVLLPKQRLAMNGTIAKIDSTDVLPYEYWRDGYLYFDNIKLRDIMVEIGKHYNMTIEFLNLDIMNDRMRFIANRHESVDETVNLINSLGKVKVMRNGNVLKVN